MHVAFRLVRMKVRVLQLPAAVAAICLLEALGSAAPATAADERHVWEYTGGFGTSWFVHGGGKKWVLFRGDGETYLYVEESRTADAIEMRGPSTKLLVRLTASDFHLRRSPDDPWRRSAGGRWVGEGNLPEKIRELPTAYAVRLVYFVPSDRDPAPNYAPKIRTIMSVVSELIHQDLRAKGYRPKRLEFESQGGEATVHLLRGEKSASHYNADWDSNPQAQMTKIHGELQKRLSDPDRRLTVVFAETYEPGPAKEAWAGHIARGIAMPPEGGLAVYSSWILKDEFSAADRDAQRALFFDRTPIAGRKAFGSRVANSPRYEFVEDAFGAVVHELGHALGLPHDYRSPRNIMGSGFRELRWNFDPRAPASHKASFSNDNARMLMSSRYLAEDLDLEDFDPPSVELELTRRGRNLAAAIRAEDAGELRALLIYDRTKKASSLLGGKALRGGVQRITERLPADLRAPGLKPTVEIFVSDNGGNVARATKSLEP